MNIHFNHTEPVKAPAEVLFDVITDYTRYPSFNSAVIKVEVVTKDENGADFPAPGSPRTTSTPLSPERACASRRSIIAISAPRPTSTTR